MIRDVYAVVVTSVNGIAPRATRMDTHDEIAKMITILVVANNNPVTPEDIAIGAAAISGDVDRYQAWAWDGRRVPHTARVGQIPRPGVVFIIETELLDEHGGFAPLGLQIKRLLSADDGPAKFRRHLAGPAADVNPQPLSIVDVLVSAAPADQAVAAEIEAALQAAGLSTERAAWPTKRDLGDDDGRRRFLGCQILVTVLSEHSVGDPRPSIEAGAAWALGKPWVPLLAGVAKADLPPSMATRQCVDASDAAALARLPEQIKLLVLGR